VEDILDFVLVVNVEIGVKQTMDFIEDPKVARRMIESGIVKNRKATRPRKSRALRSQES
jgi:hypothetical protein